MLLNIFLGYMLRFSVKSKIMKRIFFIFSIFIMTLSLHASGNILDGSWYNPHIKRSIIIKHQRDGLQIKGIHSRYGWTWFERCSKNTYCDRYDNLIKISGRNRIVYYKRDRRARLTFYPVSDINVDRRYRDTYDEEDWYSDNYRSDGNRYNDYDEKYNHKNDDITINRNHIKHQSPEGTWESIELGKKVFIVDTRDGLKARFSDDPRWYIFKTEEDKSGVFISDKGHRYEYLDENNLLWIDNSGKRKYKLTKLSDEIE